MKLLVLSNLYPPHFVGGYDLACHEMVERLKARGHEVAVLTSRYGLEDEGRGQAAGEKRNPEQTSGGVYRSLTFQMPPHLRRSTLREQAAIEYRDTRVMRRVLAVERPDLIYVWNMGGLTRSLLGIAHAHPAPVVYEIFDCWLSQPPDVHAWAAFWRGRPAKPLKRLLKKPARWIVRQVVPVDLPALDLRHVLFKSQMLKRAALESGLPVADAPVIYHGVDRAIFHPGTDPPARRDARACRVLYVGQLAPHKGVHTLLEAFARLAHEPDCDDTRLTVVGGGMEREYRDQLRDTVNSCGLVTRVCFRETVSRSELPAIYRAHDVLVFPSIWQEPFGLTQIEAMACGLPVIGTGTGGSAEILTDDTALRFPPGDAAALAGCIARLAGDTDLRKRMSHAAICRVAEHFDIEGTVRRTERYLLEGVASPRTSLTQTRWQMPLPTEL